MPSFDDLIRELVDRDGATGAELTRALGISAPTLSRLVRAAGSEVTRVGAARATRYFATRAILAVESPIPVFRVGSDGMPRPYASLQPIMREGHILRLSAGKAAIRFVGLPPFASDMRPQGYLGHAFAAAFHSELGLSPRVTDWQDDHVLQALTLRGDDCIGDVIIGAPALERWSSTAPRALEREQYAAAAAQSRLGQAGSSAGGDHPKFSAWRNGRHLLVKFWERAGSAAAERWADLLACEALAARTLLDGGHSAVEAECFDAGGLRFLEMTRFDRLGRRGRRGVLSLAVIDNEYVGSGGGWINAGRALLRVGRIDAKAYREICFLDVFGAQIANGDRHLYNLSFFADPIGTIDGLTPTYDMLPMDLAPQQTTVVDRPFVARGPTAETLPVWRDATDLAIEYWRRVSVDARIGDEVREIAVRNRAALEKSVAEFGGVGATPSPSASTRSP